MKTYTAIYKMSTGKGTSLFVTQFDGNPGDQIPHEDLKVKIAHSCGYDGEQKKRMLKGLSFVTALSDRQTCAVDLSTSFVYETYGWDGKVEP